MNPFIILHRARRSRLLLAGLFLVLLALAAAGPTRASRPRDTSGAPPPPVAATTAPVPWAAMAVLAGDAGVPAPSRAPRAAPGQGTPTPTPACTSWTVDSHLPYPVMGAAVAALGGYVYAAGGWRGYVASGVQRYSGSGAWTPVASLPNPIEAAAGVSDGNRFFVVGGYNASGPTSWLQIYDPATNTWSQGTAIPLAVAFANVAYAGGKLYVMGGCSTGSCAPYRADLQIYDIAANTWSVGAAVPVGGAAGAAAAFGGYIYLVSGTGAICYRYDIAADTWSDAAMADLPFPLGLSGSAVRDGKFYLFGGSGPTPISNQTLSYDPPADQWTIAPATLAVPVYRTGAALLNGNFYVVGGATAPYPTYGWTDIVQRDDTACVTPGPTATSTPPPPTPTPSCNDWTYDTPLPFAVRGAAVAAIGDYIYVAGGYNSSGYNLTAWRYNGSGGWQARAAPPIPGEGGPGVTDGSRFYVIGGYAGSGPSSHLRIYDPATDTWSQGAPLPLTVALAGAAYAQGKIYVVGGCSTTACVPFRPDLQIYDIAANTWSAGAPLPEGVAANAAGAIGGYIYAAGGGTTSGSGEKTYRYDIAANTWSDAAMADLPAGREMMASAVLNGRFYLMGGDDGLTPFNTILAYDPGTDTWTTLGPRLNLATLRMYGTAFRNSLYVVSGATSFSPWTYSDRVEHSILICATPTPEPTHTPTATPTATPCALTFTDVDVTNPFYPFIRCLACRGIVSGYADGSFRWGADVTRGQLAKIIAGAAGLTNAIPSTQQTFADVPVSNTFWLFIERLAGTGAISGYACGGAGEPCLPPTNRPYFRWGANATRGQISKIAATAAGYSEPIPTDRQTFADVPNTNPFWAFIERLTARQIISGYQCGGPGEPCVPPQNRPYFRWGNNTTRGQLAKIGASTFFPNCQTPTRR